MDGGYYGIGGYSCRVVYEVVAINVALGTSCRLGLVVIQVGVFALARDLIAFKLDN